MKTKNSVFAKIAAILLIAVLLPFAGCSTDDIPSSDGTPGDNGGTPAPSGIFRDLDEIKASGKVVIGVFSDKAPFGYIDANGKYQGYDVYFAERIAKDLGVSVEYKSVEPASRVEFLETGKVDIILANFTVTPERAQKVDFALPYMKVALGVVSPDSALITDVEQLKGKTLIVAKGTTAESFFTDHYPEVSLLKFDQYTETFNALLDGRADAFSTDNTEVLAWALQNPGYTVGIPSLGGLDSIAPAVTKGNATLLNWINDEIKALAGKQFFHADYAETLASVYGDTVDPDNLVVEGGVIEGAGIGGQAAAPVKIVIGATPVPHAELLEAVKAILAAQGIELTVKEFTDYVQPNLALDSGDLDANFFQHRPYLNDFNAEHDLTLVDIGDIHYEPFGLFPGKAKGLDGLADKAQIAVPNDPTNEARALLLLEAQGLIKVREGAGLSATVLDIVENPKNLQIVELEAAQIPRSLQDVDLAVINGNYALEAGLNAASDALAVEDKDSLAADTFANVIVVRAGDENRAELAALVRALQSEEIRAFINDKYDGAVVPKF